MFDNCRIKGKLFSGSLLTAIATSDSYKICNRIFPTKCMILLYVT